ncbi:MAG TPA: Co2+/Mg2+ efflux protein ApaG [Phaeodactylibacter sp.]|nr:Co2+/Mg2+ efflux protein ApaG [Phaeodactylibacter sp.]
MNTLTTNGITISVESFYQHEHSNVRLHKYVYSYRITIQNKSNTTVQLLRRHWFIQDSLGPKKEVEGDGVIGKQPILHPGESHQYTSWTILHSDIGKMYGTYLMHTRPKGKSLYVRIPEFKLIAPFRLN